MPKGIFVRQVKDRVGKTYGELTVVRRVENGKQNKTMWLCLCTCGKEYITSGNALQSGNTKSCGHIRKHAVCKRGHIRTPENVGINGECRECSKITSGAWYNANEANKELTKTRSSIKSLKIKGWTPEAVEKAKQLQKNLCAICHKEFKGTPHADHEHSIPPKPRELLCGPCNLAIGLMYDSSALCEAAAAYLRKWGK